MVAETRSETSRRQQYLLLLACIALAVPLALWARFHLATLRAYANPGAEPNVTAAAEQAQPVIDALEKYRADNGLYPASLDRLSPGYLASTETLRGFRYSARRSDWVFQSDACLAREQVLEWKLTGVKANRPQAARFADDCLSGFRDYQLQSPDFSHDGNSRYVERWAYYDSQPQHWTVGWCEQVRTASGNAQELATNGICRVALYGKDGRAFDLR